MRTALRDLEIRLMHAEGAGLSCLLCRSQFPNQSIIHVRMRHHLGEYSPGSGICTAQHFTRNHVRYYRQTGDVANLRLAVARARELWNHRADTEWLDAAAEHAADPVDLFDLLDG